VVKVEITDDNPNKMSSIYNFKITVVPLPATLADTVTDTVTDTVPVKNMMKNEAK
jgi:hypothetical protein